MHRNQFDDLKEKTGLKNGYGEVPPNQTVMLYLTTGRQKGKLGKLISIDDTNLLVQVEGAPKPLTFMYTKIELADDNGNPIHAKASDITGRPITGNEVVCYSVSVGENSHALEIGRVIRTTPSGNLSVQPVIQNGNRITNTYRRKPRNIKAERSIILPVDSALVITWVLSDFDLFHGDELEDG